MWIKIEDINGINILNTDRFSKLTLKDEKIYFNELNNTSVLEFGSKKEAWEEFNMLEELLLNNNEEFEDNDVREIRLFLDYSDFDDSLEEANSFFEDLDVNEVEYQIIDYPVFDEDEYEYADQCYEIEVKK